MPHILYVYTNTTVRYDPTVPQLLEARHRCRGLAADFNQVDAKKYSYDQIGEVRMEILKKLVGRVGEGTFIEPPFMPDYGCNMIIGKDCFFNWKSVFHPFLQKSISLTNS